jgi:hypothetical protein
MGSASIHPTILLETWPDPTGPKAGSRMCALEPACASMPPLHQIFEEMTS